MRPEYQTFDVPQTTGASPGESLLTEHFREMTVFIHPLSGTYQVQGTIDGTNWVDIGTAVTGGDGLVQVPGTIRRLRLACSVNSGGTATATFAGKNSRSD